VTVGPVGAELVERRDVLPGQRIDTFHAPAIAVAAQPGQFVDVLQADDDGLVLRRPVAISSADPSNGLVSLHLEQAARPGPLERVRPGDRVELAGPHGRPFEVDARSRHLLVIAVGAAVGRVRLLMDRAIGDDRQVTLLFGAPSAKAVYPSTLLPDEVEYVVATEDGSLGHAGSVVGLIPQYEAWADQAFAAGPRPLLGELAKLAAGRLARMGVARLGRKRGRGRSDPSGSPAARRRSFLQVALDHDIACAAGTCLGCVVNAASGGPLRVCREGPVFAADELDWEPTS
jgi:dihydroorotate dehydrogenase electron transfer subunit